jgi:hypothetical protein
MVIYNKHYVHKKKHNLLTIRPGTRGQTKTTAAKKPVTRPEKKIRYAI